MVNVVKAAERARRDRADYFARLPRGCHIDVVIINDEPASANVTLQMLRAAQHQFENGTVGNVHQLGQTVLHEYTGENGAGVLVMRKFVQTLLGTDGTRQLEHEAVLNRHSEMQFTTYLKSLAAMWTQQDGKLKCVPVLQHCEEVDNATVFFSCRIDPDGCNNRFNGTNIELRDGDAVIRTTALPQPDPKLLLRSGSHPS